jgi:dienelactone hydrolase
MVTDVGARSAAFRAANRPPVHDLEPGAAASVRAPQPHRPAVSEDIEPSMQHFKSGGQQIAAEWFAAFTGSVAGARAGTARPSLLLLHGADGLTYAEGYRLAARTLAASGYHVAFVHYLDRTGDRRVAYGRLRQDFPLWTETVRDGVNWLAAQPGVDPHRLGIVGISLGAALAFATAAVEPRVRAIVDYSGPLPDELARQRPRLPPTLILHGGSDPIVPVSHARALEQLLHEQGTPHEVQVYQGQGHSLTGAAQFDAAARAARFLQQHLQPAAAEGCSARA